MLLFCCVLHSFRCGGPTSARALVEIHKNPTPVPGERKVMNSSFFWGLLVSGVMLSGCASGQEQPERSPAPETAPVTSATAAPPSSQTNTSNTSTTATASNTSTPSPAEREAELPEFGLSASLLAWEHRSQELYMEIQSVASQARYARSERDRHLQIAGDERGKNQVRSELAREYAFGWDRKYTRFLAQHQTLTQEYRRHLLSPPAELPEEELVPVRPPAEERAALLREEAEDPPPPTEGAAREGGG